VLCAFEIYPNHQLFTRHLVSTKFRAMMCLPGQPLGASSWQTQRRFIEFDPHDSSDMIHVGIVGKE
jgi:hypothetical protein